MRGAALWLILIALVLSLAGLGYAAARFLPGPAPELAVCVGPVRWRETVSLEGVVLRSERLVHAPEGVAVLDFPEGRRAAAGEPLGVAAATGEEFFRGWLLLRLERLAAAETAGWPLSESELRDGCAALRTALARRRFDGAAASAEALSFRLFPEDFDPPALQREIEALRSAGAGDAVLRAPASGFFLRSTDGWEGAADVAGAEAVEAMIARGREPTTAPGRLVTGSLWRLAALADAGTAEKFPPGKAVRLELGGEVFDAETERRLPAADGRELVVFVGRTGLERLLDLRFVRCCAVLREAEGLLLPAEALREGGTAVLRLAGRFARRESVEVLAAAEEGVLVASDGLRPGSRVLLGGEWSDGDPVS